MDKRLEEALEYSNYMVTYNNQKRILKNKFLDQNVYYAGGTKFNITKEFITFINLLLQKGQTKSVTIIDDNDNPPIFPLSHHDSCDTAVRKTSRCYGVDFR